MRMPRPSIWNAKAMTYSSELRFEDFVNEKKDASIVRFARPINEGSQKGWKFKNMVTKDIGSDKLYMAWIHFDPGGGHDYHAHTCDEAIRMLEGVAQFTYRSKQGVDVKNIIEKGDVAFIPAGVPHSFWNLGKGKCRFIVVKSPPYFLEEIPLPKELKEKRLFPRNRRNN
jgi:mannose-6-phosphate isomerase-like protein (cupin superfamily)